MKESLVKPLAYTVSLLSLPILGSVLVLSDRIQAPAPRVIATVAESEPAPAPVPPSLKRLMAQVETWSVEAPGPRLRSYVPESRTALAVAKQIVYLPSGEVPADLTARVERVEQHYRAAQPSKARQVIHEDERLLAWSDTNSLSIATHYRTNHFGGGEMEVAITRSDAAHPLAVAFPPGTYGVPQTRSQEPGRTKRYFPKAQDLALLRAPVVVFGKGQRQASIRVPVACASYMVPTPRANQPFELASFAEGSAIEKLLVTLCSGDTLKPESEAQLAVWIARNDISQQWFLRTYRRVGTFPTNRKVTPRHAAGAARLLQESGVAPKRARFFGGQAIDPPTRAKPQPSAEERRRPVTPAEPRPVLSTLQS